MLPATVSGKSFFILSVRQGSLLCNIVLLVTAIYDLWDSIMRIGTDCERMIDRLDATIHLQTQFVCWMGAGGDTGSAHSVDIDMATYTTSRVGYSSSTMVCQTGSAVDALDNGVAAMVNVFGILILEAPKVNTRMAVYLIWLISIRAARTLATIVYYVFALSVGRTGLRRFTLCSAALEDLPGPGVTFEDDYKVDMEGTFWAAIDELVLSAVIFIFSCYLIVLINRLSTIVQLGGAGDERTANPAVLALLESDTPQTTLTTSFLKNFPVQSGVQALSLTNGILSAAVIIMQIIRMAAWCGEETRLAALEKDWCVPYGGSAITESLAAMAVYTVIWSRSRRLRKSRGVRFYPHAQGVMILSSLAMLLGTLYISGSYFPVFWLDLMCLDVFCYLIRYAVGCWLLWLCVSLSVILSVGGDVYGKRRENTSIFRAIYGGELETLKADEREQRAPLERSSESVRMRRRDQGSNS
ncbi:hypothetical protein FOZ62_004379, partial [Perkinsus olseni]